jgi:hypothetical protein
MEMVSYLAGERWSDHPKCTHPLVAAVARMVNDNTTDANRSRLADLIPSVIGLTTSDPNADARIALCCATAALPIASAERQNAIAVSVLSAERALAAAEGRRRDELRESSVAALDAVPHSAAWARRFIGKFDASPSEFRRAAPHVVRIAVEGIAEACVPDADDRLYALLAAVIAECVGVPATEPTTPAGVVQRPAGSAPR